jgi:hypothetical protein
MIADAARKRFGPLVEALERISEPLTCTERPSSLAQAALARLRQEGG